MKKNLLYILLFIVPLLVCFASFNTDSYCLAESVMGNAIWNSFNIASEYYVAKTGKSIVNGNKISSDISGVSGINGGSVNTSYGDIIANNSGTPINVESLMALAQDVDTSKMSAADLNALSVQIANSPWVNDGSIAMKNITYGGISLYFAVNKAGEWLGNSYNNIVAKFKPMTASESTALTSTIVSEIPRISDVLYGKTFNLDCYDSAGNKHITYMQFSKPVYLYTLSSGSSGLYKLRMVYEEGNEPTISGVEIYGNSTYQIRGWGGTNVNSFYGPDQLHYQDVHLQISGYGTLMQFFTKQVIGGSQQKVKDLMPTVVANDGEYVYNVNYVTNLGDVYTVPDFDDLAIAIGDVYEVIDKIRESIITFPTADDIVRLIDDTLADTLSDTITDIKANGLTVTDEVTTTIPVEADINQGITIPADFDTDIVDSTLSVFELPFQFISIFEPLFYIFGAFNGMFAIFSFIPLVIIGILIIWALK